MKLMTQRRLAAQMLKCGETRVWFDPARLAEIKEAITKQDIRSLIKDLAVQKHQVSAISGFKRKKMIVQRRKGRRGGLGSRKGKKTARLHVKTSWMRRIRAQRIFLKNLKGTEKIGSGTFGKLYALSKGGFFRSRKHIQRYMEEHNLVNNETQNNHTSTQEKKAR